MHLWAFFIACSLSTNGIELSAIWRLLRENLSCNYLKHK